MKTSFFNSLRFRIGYGYIILIVINITVTIWTVYTFWRLTNALDDILGNNYPSILAAENMARAIDRYEHAVSSVLNNDKNNGVIEMMMAKEDFQKAFQTAQAKKMDSLAGAILENIRSTYAGYEILTKGVLDSADEYGLERAKAFRYNTMPPFSERLTDNCFWLVEENQKQMTEVRNRTNTLWINALQTIGFSWFIALAISVFIMVRVATRIIRPAELLTDTVRQIGRGHLDLKIDVQTDDEFGELSREFNKMTERLRRYEAMNVEQILLEKQKSETIVTNITDPIIVCGADGSVVLLNPSAEELCQKKEREVLGRHISDLTTDERITRLFDEKAPLEPYLEFERGGRKIFLRPRVSPIISPSGMREGMVVILQDVTQFRELDKAKSDFMATVSHEFRTPVTSITMGVDILRQHLLGPLTEAQEELLRSFKQDCERLTKLVRDLLQLSKIESKEIRVREDKVDLVQVVGTVVRSFNIQFKEKGVSLAFRCDEELPPIIGDEQHFMWVLSNLISNALQYTDAGGSVDISAGLSGGNIVVKVRDTGHGIPQEYLEKVFDKFVQVKQGYDPTPGSVGLGLAIAKDIVDLYGGKIWAESELGHGSLFTFRIPVSQGEHIT